jgi:hypothetical protein
VDYCRQQCDEKVNFSLYEIRPSGDKVNLADVEQSIRQYCDIKGAHVVFLPPQHNVQETAKMYKVQLHLGRDKDHAGVVLKRVEKIFSEHRLHVRRASIELQLDIFVVYLLITQMPSEDETRRCNPNIGERLPPFSRMKLLKARAAVEEEFGHGAEMLIEGIASDRDPLGEAAHGAVDLLKPIKAHGDVPTDADIISVSVHAPFLLPNMLGSFLNTTMDHGIHVVSVYVDERARRKIRASLALPSTSKYDGQDASGYIQTLRQAYVDGFLEVGAQSSVTIAPIFDRPDNNFISVKPSTPEISTDGGPELSGDEREESEEDQRPRDPFQDLYSTDMPFSPPGRAHADWRL